MFKNFLRLFPVLALAVMAALPVSASAAGGGGGTGINVSVGTKATIQARLFVTVPVTISCAAPLADAPLGFGLIDVGLEQAVGRSVAHGSGDLIISTCPSTPTTFKVVVRPDLFPTPSPTFHGGPAIVNASAFAEDPTGTIFQAGAAGPLVMIL